MRKILTILAVATAITTSGWIAAQEGGKQDKLTGTVKSVDTKALVLKIETADKKIVAFSVTGNTRIARGDAAAMLAEVETGARIVVTTEQGKPLPVATEIQLAAPPPNHP